MFSYLTLYCMGLTILGSFLRNTSRVYDHFGATDVLKALTLPLILTVFVHSGICISLGTFRRLHLAFSTFTWQSLWKCPFFPHLKHSTVLTFRKYGGSQS